MEIPKPGLTFGSRGTNVAGLSASALPPFALKFPIEWSKRK